MCINNNTPTDASIQGLQGSRLRPRTTLKAKTKAKDLGHEAKAKAKD